jgi:hypothetical protein
MPEETCNLHFFAPAKTMYMIKRLLLSAITILTVVFSYAQETTSQILGTVSDGKTGLGGATVVALHTPTGTKYTTTTRKDGRFNLPGLRVGGPYTLTISYVGFKEEKQENIILTLGQDFTSDFSMISQAKELAATVVSAARQNKVFNNARTGTQEVITRAQIEQLPTINRSIQDFTKLEPSSSGLSFAGTNPGENNITVDGADFNNSFGLASTLGGQANAQPIALDAIDQIQVNVAPYDVRQGGFVGAGVNSVTRSGTNQFRGTVYDYTKGPGTQGYKVDNTTVARTPFKYNVLGGSLGGAFIPNKLFFFINAEQDIQTAPATSYIASDATHPVTAGSVSQVSADSLNMISNYLINTLHYNPGTYQGYTFKTNSYKINTRIDFNINNDNVLSLKYNYLKSYTDQFASTSRSLGGSGLITGGQPGNQSMPFSGSGYRINNNLGVWIAELNTRFGNSASNKLQVGYTRERDFRSPQSSSTTFPLVDILANGGLNGGNIATTFGYEPFTYNNTLNMDSYQLTDIFEVFKGAHELTFGSQNSYKKYQNAFAPGWNGDYQFNSFADFLNGANAVAYGQDYSTLKGNAFPWAYAGATNLSLFAQDKFRVTPTFTLTYGVRVDYTTYQNKFTDNPNFDALTFVNNTTYNVGKAPESFLVVSPRVGFNWDITGDRTWQLRGGAGIFEGAPPFVWLENQAANNGVQLGSFTEGGTKGNKPTSIPFYSTAQQGLNYYLQQSGQVQTATPFGYSVDVTDKHFKYPTKLRTSLGLDRKLPDNWIVTIEGSYSKDINATYMANANLNESNAYQLSNGPDNRLRYQTATTTSNEYYYQGTSLTQPNLGSVIVLKNTNKGYSWYSSFRVQKTIHNFSASATYIYQDSKTTMENGSTASSLWSARAVANTDPNAPTIARPSWYQPQRIIASANYKFEYAKHFATIIGFVFEATPSGVSNYTYSGDVNGDGNTSNDLIYIPRSSSEINLIDVGSYNKTTQSGVTSGTASDPRNSSQIWTQLSNFIQQDHYLYHHRGHYAQANSVVLPWFKHLDMHLEEDIFAWEKTKSGSDRHTLSLTMDMLNVGNFLDRNWGLVKTTTLSSILKFEGMAADNKTPLFSFPYLDPTNLVPLTNSFANSTSTGSRWQMQVGLRYMFN